MTTKRDCVSCHYGVYGNREYEPCASCWRENLWKPAERREIKRRLNHLQKILNEVYSE